MDNRINAIILLVIGTIFWGMTFAFTKTALNDIDAYSFLAFRFLIGTILLSLVFFNRLFKINFSTIYKGFLLSIPLTIAFFTQTIGLEFTTASNGGFITAFAIVIVPFLDAINRKSLPSSRIILAIAIATIGLLLITATSISSFNPGDLLMIICAIAFAFYIILVAKESGKSDAILITIVQLLVVSISSFFMALLFDGIQIPSSRDSWTGILFCALFATTFMYTVQNHYQQFLSTNTTVIIFSLEPFFAAITAVVMLSESLSGNIIIGGILIITGTIISEFRMKVAVKKCNL